MKQHIPLLEFDPTREAIIEPTKVIRHRDVPEHCIFSFFKEVIDHARESLNLQPLHPIKSEMGDIPVFSGTYNGMAVAIVSGAIGAPFAAGVLEEIIARGGRKFVVCGGAGVLDKSIGSGDIVVPTSALRDEGTSYHYLPSGRDAHPSPQVVESIVRVLERHKCQYRKGKTWTTDAIYRETPNKIAKRREQGCLTVEMEAAALFAVAEFRGVLLGQLLYGGDDISGIEWDPREFGQPIPARDSLFRLSLEACVEVEEVRPRQHMQR